MVFHFHTVRLFTWKSLKKKLEKLALENLNILMVDYNFLLIQPFPGLKSKKKKPF